LTSESSPESPDRLPGVGEASLEPIGQNDAPARTLKLTVEYEGTAYQGWQYQPDVATIQGQIEAALARILSGPHRIHGAGRTDAGVHARGQVAHFTTHHPMACPALHKALNAVLPRDIAVVTLEEVGADFHSRKQAHRKQYSYTLLNRPHRSVFWERFAWWLPHALDVEAMLKVCDWLPGRRDFNAFRAADCSARTSVRELYACRLVVVAPGVLRLELEGNGFLKHMVRNLVGTLVEVGQGRRTLEGFQQVLAGRDRTRAGKTAPARGLCLEWVQYGDASELAGRFERVGEDTGEDPA
jgi:tRNA pseudouridine38-40 synthase